MNKSLRKDDIVNTPFVATKEWELSNTLNTDVILSEAGNPIAVEFVSYGSGDGNPVWDTSCNIAKEQQEIDRVNYREGERRSGIFYSDTEPTNADGTYKRLVYAQIKGIFYNKYRDPTKMWGMEYIDFEKSQTKKFLSDNIRLFDIPQVIFGEKILENSVFITDNTLDNDYLINDDGFNNLIAGTNIFLRFQETYPFVNVFESGSNDLCKNYLNFSPPLTSVLTATLIDTPYVELNWTDAGNETGYVLERSTNSGSTYSVLAYPGTNVLTYNDFEVVVNNMYWYRVYSFNTFGNSDYSNTCSILIPSDFLYDLTGSLYISGPYDTFESYTSGSVPTNGGFGWSGSWVSRTLGAPGFIYVVAEDNLTGSGYTSGSFLNGLNGGDGWGGPWSSSL